MPEIDVTPPGICDPMAPAPLPVLPDGFSIDGALPSPGTVFDIRLCCKIFQLPVGLAPPISLGIAVPIPFVLALNTAIRTINTYVRALPMRCPKER